MALLFFKVGYQLLLSNSKKVYTYKAKKRRQLVPLLKKYLGKFDIKPSRLVLSILALIEKEAYSATGIETFSVYLSNHGCKIVK